MAIDLIDLSSEDSFPASDPPGWGSYHASSNGDDDFVEMTIEPAQPRVAWKRVAVAAGVLVFAAAIWGARKLVA